MRYCFWLLFCLALPVQANTEAHLSTCLSLAKQQTQQSVLLASDCPDLYMDLTNLGLLSNISDTVSLKQLQLLANSMQPSRQLLPVQHAELDKLLADIVITEARDPSAEWWQALLKWLDSLKGDDYEDKYQWLQQFLDTIKPSEQTVKMFFYALIGLLVLMSVWLVISELYYAGFLQKLTGKSKPRRIRQITPTIFSTQPAVIPDQLSTQQQIAVWLNQVIDRLAEQQLIPLDHSLTYRQIQAYLSQQASPNLQLFQQLLSTAEPVVYGARPIDTDSLSRYRNTVQRLLGRPL
ncbi:hypothetical protein [Methylomonas sp. AM2-LC]|uniref:hypothetical protein n=1 Tax=Methylomonas sp. AM2-LC TaxID=3153301 RepID=UPI003265BE87